MAETPEEAAARLAKEAEDATHSAMKSGHVETAALLAGIADAIKDMMK